MPNQHETCTHCNATNLTVYNLLVEVRECTRNTAPTVTLTLCHECRFLAKMQLNQLFKNFCTPLADQLEEAPNEPTK